MNVSKISSICDYHGEYSSFGEEGWKIAYKFFEYGSRIALLKKDTLRRLEATSDSEARREILRFLGHQPKTIKKHYFMRPNLYTVFSIKWDIRESKMMFP